MKRHSSAASLALAALVVLEFAGPVAASTFSVLNVADGGFGSLRAAIAAANAQPGADVIHFTRQVRGTIVLSSGPLDITGDVEIRGRGAWRLAMRGRRLGRNLNI